MLLFDPLALDAGDLFQSCLKLFGVSISSIDCILQLEEAVVGKDGVEFRHAGVEPCKSTVVLAVVSVFSSGLYGLSEGGVIGCDEAAFASGCEFCGAQAKALCVTLSADRGAAIGAAKSVGGVEDQPEVVLLSDGLQGLTVGRVSIVVNGNDGRRFWCKRVFNLLMEDVGCFQINVNKNGSTPGPHRGA